MIRRRPNTGTLHLSFPSSSPKRKRDEDERRTTNTSPKLRILLSVISVNGFRYVQALSGCLSIFHFAIAFGTLCITNKSTRTHRLIFATTIEILSYDSSYTPYIYTS